MNTKQLPFGLLAVFLFGAANAQAQTSAYTITDIGDLGGGYSRAYGVNNKGEVVGKSYTADGRLHPFLYSGGTMKDLGNFGGNSIPARNDTGAANGINDSGQVVGVASSNNGLIAFLYSNGTLQALPYATQEAINNNGQRVGWSTHATLYSNGVYTDLGTFGGISSSAYGINNLGQVVGNADLDANANGGFGADAFLYSNGTLRDIGKDTGLYFTEGHGINDSGVVVGVGSLSSDGSASLRGFIWQNGQSKTLGTLGGGRDSFARAINNSGVVVGNSFVAAGYSEPFVYQNGVMSDVFAGTGWSSGDAAGINDLGQIVGYGDSPDGYLHAFLATPRSVVPAPGSLLVAVVGGGLLAARLRRRKSR